MPDLSASDTKLLKLIQADGGLSRKELSERLGMSGSTLWRRLTELESAGIIRGRAVLLDPEAVGLPVCVFVFVNLANYKPQTRDAFEAYVDEVPHIMECYAVTGAHDYTLIMRVESVAQFERLLREDILEHPSVANASSQIALRQHKYETALPI